MLQRSILSALESCVRALPGFLDRYLPSILVSLLDRSIYEYDAAYTEKASIRGLVMTVLSTMADKVPPKQLIGRVFEYKIQAKNGKGVSVSSCG